MGNCSTQKKKEAVDSSRNNKEIKLCMKDSQGNQLGYQQQYICDSKTSRNNNFKYQSTMIQQNYHLAEQNSQATVKCTEYKQIMSKSTNFIKLNDRELGRIVQVPVLQSLKENNLFKKRKQMNLKKKNGILVNDSK